MHGADWRKSMQEIMSHTTYSLFHFSANAVLACLHGTIYGLICVAIVVECEKVFFEALKLEKNGS